MPNEWDYDEDVFDDDFGDDDYDDFGFDDDYFDNEDTDDDFDQEIGTVEKITDVYFLEDKIKYAFEYQYTDFIHRALRVLSDTAINKPELSNNVLETFCNIPIPQHYILGKLEYICKNKPELADKAFEIFSKKPNLDYDALGYIVQQNPELTDKALKLPINELNWFSNRYLSNIFENSPNLADKILDKINETIDSSGKAYYETYTLITKIMLKKPEVKDKAFKTMKKLLKLNAKEENFSHLNTSIAYENLHQIIHNKPEFADQAFDVFKEAIKSDKNNENSLINAYKDLSLIYQYKPKLTKHLTQNIIETLKEAVNSDKNNPKSLTIAYKNLTEIAIDNPEFADQTLDIFKKAIKSDKNNEDSLIEAYEQLTKIALNNPEFADQTLDIFKETIKSNKNNEDILIEAYEQLTKIALNKPETASKVVETIKLSIQSDINNTYSLKGTYFALDKIVRAKPELAEQIFDTFKEAFKSDKILASSLVDAYKILGEIATNEPKLASQVVETIKVGIQSEENNINILKSAYSTLANIVAIRPELAKQVFNIAKTNFPHEAEYIAKHQYFILSKCMKSKDAKEFVEKATKHKQELQACYNMRFSTKEECYHLVENYNINEIAQMSLSSQQRCMNVLVNQVAKELKTDTNQALDYRANPHNKIYIHNADWLIPASMKASKLFGCWFPSYIKQTQGYLNAHDSVYWLPKDMGPEKNASFVSFVQRNLIYDANGEKKVRTLAEMEIIANAWKNLSPNEEKLKYKDILAICRCAKYNNVEHRDFAVEASKWGVQNYQYKNFEDIYTAGLNVPEPFDSSKEFRFGKYCGRFLPREDARVGFFGGYTDCCQHFNGVGKECAISSIKDPYSQLFVIEDETGKIVAGSWVWENKEGTHRDVCFDNIEALGDFHKHPMLNKIYRMAGRYLTDEANCHKVTIGMGYQDADTSQYAKTESVALPKQYGDKYSDAKGNQVLLFENPNATPLDKSTESLRFVRKACFLDIDAMENISEQCFPEGDQRLQTPDRLTGLALVDENKGVVGYCLYDKEEKSIYDMAVLPEYRTDKNASSQKLFAALIKDIKEIGGTWTAELRDATTYRYIETMQKRGLVSFETNGIDHTMSDGSKVYSVSFKVNDTKNSKQLSVQNQKE